MQVMFFLFSRRFENQLPRGQTELQGFNISDAQELPSQSETSVVLHHESLQRKVPGFLIVEDLD